MSNETYRLLKELYEMGVKHGEENVQRLLARQKLEKDFAEAVSKLAQPPQPIDRIKE